MANIVYGKTLVCLEIATEERYWNRSYLTSYAPTDEQYESYYRVLCGFPDAKVTVRRITVPDGFNATLLKPLDTAPTVFPQSDLESGPEETEKRQNYKKFIDGLIEMEQSRVNLNFFVQQDVTAELSAEAANRLEGFRSWVREVLDILSTEMRAEVDVEQKFPTIGWIIAPTATAARRSNGLRLIVSEQMGTTWERLLGTDHFPDLLVARRLHASNWRHPTELSNNLYKQILEWYLCARNCEYSAGISDWILTLESEILTMITGFQNIAPVVRVERAPELPLKALMAHAFFNPPESRQQGVDPEYDSLPAEAFLADIKPGSKRAKAILAAAEVQSMLAENPLREEFKIYLVPDIPTPIVGSIRDLLPHVEAILAPIAVWSDRMSAISEGAFFAFLIALVKKFHIPEKELECDAVNVALKRWLEQGLGFKPDNWPIVKEWFPTWRAVIRNFASEQRVLFFLTTVSQKPQLDIRYVDVKTRDALINGWSGIFMETFMIPDPKGSIQSMDVYEQAKQFTLQFLPKTPWGRSLTPQAISPCFTLRGFQSVKRGTGRRLYGIRYKTPTEISNDLHSLDKEFATEVKF